MNPGDRVSEILGAHFAGGELEDPEAVIRAHPEHAEQLREAFRARDALRQALASPVASSPGSAPERDFVPGGGRKPPFRFGAYDIEAEIARGGMGVVYRAHDRNLDRRVALKMVRAGALATPDELYRFRTEAEAAASLDHPGIVAIHDVGSVDGQPYFTMRLVEGGDLASRATAHAGDVRWAVRLVETLARAVEYGHQRGVLHRDLKPGNVLLEADERPVITDFGLARRIDGRAPGPTETGSVLGTPEYMAPEQALGDTRGITTAADVWSLGVILYELLAGALPFVGDHPIKVLQKVIKEDPLPPSRAAAGVPRDLDAICLRCLSKEPRERYPSAGALADDLGRFLAGLPVTARRLGLAARAIRWGRRHPAGTTVAALVLTAVVGWIALTLGQARELAATERRLRAPLYATLAAQAARADPPHRAGLLFARSAELHSTRVGRIGMLAHRRPVPLRVVPLARGEIWRIVFDRSGALAAVGTNQGVFLWDIAADQARPLAAGVLTGPVRGLAFHPDGRRLATGGEDGVVALWDLASGRQLAICPERAPPIGPRSITSLAVVGRGRYVVFGGTDEHLWIWELESNRCQQAPFEPVDTSAPGDPRPAVDYVASDAAGGRVAVGATVTRRGATQRFAARLWDVETARFLPGARDLEGIPWCLYFARDGRRLASAEGAGVACWSTEDPARVSRLPPDHGIGCVAFDREGRTVVYGTVRGYVRRWDPETDFEIGVPILQPQAVRALAVTPAGEHLATGGEDGVLRLWEMPTGAPEARIVRDLPGVTTAAVAAGDRWLLAATSEPALILIDLSSGQTATSLPLPGPVVGSLRATAAEGGWRCIAQEAATGATHWLEVRMTPQERLEITNLGALPGFPSSASPDFDPAGTSLCATGRDERVLRRWSRVDTALRADIVAQGVQYATFANGGEVLILLEDQGKVRVIGAAPPYGQRASFAVGSNFMSLAATPDARRIAVWTNGSPTSLIVDGTNGQTVGALPPGNSMQCLFSPDGSALFTNVADSAKIEFVDGASGQPLGKGLLHPAGRIPKEATFSPSGELLAVTTDAGEVHVWDVRWLRDDPDLDVGAEWERAQLAVMSTIDDDGSEHDIPLRAWRERRGRWTERERR